MRCYLDHNATTPLRPEARRAMMDAMEVVGNPSSVHVEGRAAKAIVEKARTQVAEAIGATPGEVVFTSGATEAINLAFSQGWDHSACSPLEHDAVLRQTRVLSHDPQTGAALVGADGVFGGTDVSHYIDFLNVSHSIFAITAANSETGVLQPVAATRRALKQAAPNAHLLCDATQAFGKTEFRFAELGCDYAAVSAHKIGGPKGVGALIVRQGIDITSGNIGGGQEMGRRSGTENVIGIAGFGAACAAAAQDISNQAWNPVAKLRNILEKALEAEAKTTILVSKDAARLPNTLCFATPGWKGETQVMQMDLAGFAVSAGSACSSGKVKASTVLQAMGYDEDTASSAIRVSLGLGTTQEDVLRFAETWLKKEKLFRARAA
jgi:cysteine desulfurase